jgi:hypothetical protein
MGPWSNASMPSPPGHDCDYVRQRKALIVEAERNCDAETQYE